MRNVGSRYRKLFPAHAGVILPVRVKFNDMDAFPRTRGGDPYKVLAAELEVLFSPHTRG